MDVTVRTWYVETAVIALALAVVAVASGNLLTEWVGTLAVLVTFLHGQVADRLAEREAVRDRPGVACHRWAGRYFVAKEALWFVYFVAHRSWSALAGVLLFLAYPAWRRWYRARNPLAS